MDGTECAPVTVEGDWSPAQNRTVRNKLQVYFQSKKKSSGGECRVEVDDGTPRAAIYFSSEEVRRSVLARKSHEVILENRTVRLHLTSGPVSGDQAPFGSANATAPSSEVQPEDGASAADTEESVQISAVVLDNIVATMSSDMLLMLVENVSGVDERCFSLEIIWEANSAVVTFHSPADVQKFLAVSQSSQKLQKLKLTVRPLEAAKSVRVENLPPTADEDMLELYFEKNWATPESISMTPEEQAATVTFTDPKVVRTICTKQDYKMRSIPIKVYPYYKSLGTALYGKDRPDWKLPDPFTEKVHHVVWKFLQKQNLSSQINHHMRPYFCSVDLENPEVKLSPLPCFLRHKGLTEKQVDMWKSAALEAFRQHMSQYSAFECAVNAPAWKAAEKDVQSVVREDGVLVVDESRETLTVAGRADSMKLIRTPVENIVLKAMSQIKRQTEGVSEEMTVSPAVVYILKQEGLHKAVQDISPDMNLSYDEATQKLTLAGLPAEVLQTKAWILGKNAGMSKKTVHVPPGVWDFLKSVNPMDMSQDLFTSQGISAIYSVDETGVLLMGSCTSSLADAETKIKTALTVKTLDVKDPEVLKLDSWMELKKELWETYNSQKRKTVAIQVSAEKVMTAGFLNPVNEVSRALNEFIKNNSRVKESLRVQSCAVVQFIDKRKKNVWLRNAKENDVKVNFDKERPRISLSGARQQVRQTKSCLQELIRSLSTDTFTINIPGAKKYFLSQGSLFLPAILSEENCMVVLRLGNQEEEEEDEEEEEEEEEDYGEENSWCFCRVQTLSGVVVSVSQADICHWRVDAVVNAANEDLQHIGGLALALLKAAGPELQKVSNDYVAMNGQVRPGDAAVTGAGNLPCKYVIHAVGPRFSDSDRKTAVSRLKQAVNESLRQADSNGCSSVALPAISSGVFGFPVDLCADTIAQAVRQYCDSPGSLTEIHLVNNNDSTAKALATAVSREFADFKPTLTLPQQSGRKHSAASGGHQRSRGQGRRSRGGRFGDRGRGGRGGKGAAAGPQRGHQPDRSGSHGRPRRLEQTTSQGLKIVLCKGNIQDQTTEVIVNTISETMDLSQGAVSKAILGAAGPGLQAAIRSEAGASKLAFGDVVVTNSFGLNCMKIFHAVCPFWNSNNGTALEEFISIIRYCLAEAEKRRLTSLSFPAIGTGGLGFPRDVVSRVLLQEIHSYSDRRAPRHLQEVAVVVHPSDSQSVDCFTREFKGERSSRREDQEVNEAGGRQPLNQTPQASASVSQVTSQDGVYQMVMGQLTLEVSAGDITKEACDVIVNSSNTDFTLRAGVSKAILDNAGPGVVSECAQIVNSPGYQPRPMILTSAGLLPSRNIIHIVASNDSTHIKEIVYSVLKLCEDNSFRTVSFPALGTGQGGLSPSEVAEAMVGAVVDFVRKKRQKSVCSVKILIFQPAMMTAFHRSMMKREGEDVGGGGILTRVKAAVSDTWNSISSVFTGQTPEQSGGSFSPPRDDNEPPVFDLCADSDKAISQAKKKISALIEAERIQKDIPDSFISLLSRADMDQLKDLQKRLSVNIRLDKDQRGGTPTIHLEGLARDVSTAETAIRDMIQKVERGETRRTKALLASGLVEWQYSEANGKMVAFDIYNNLTLEEALESKQRVTIEINGEKFTTDVKLQKAESVTRRRKVDLLRKVKTSDSDAAAAAAAAALPPTWQDMKGDLLKRFPLAAGTTEYKDVLKEFTKTGLVATIISIERIQNLTLWRGYQAMKQNLDKKNNHTNNERRLFHGTGADSIDLINKQGFNRSYAGKHAAVWGKGSYFAVDPIYSAQGYSRPDSAGHKRMYLARVLVGDYTRGSGGMITPPSKNSVNSADLYDSVTDNPTRPSMFIIFQDMQAYPEYLITFT